MGTRKLVWILILVTEPGSAADWAQLVWSTFVSEPLPHLMRELNKVSLEAGLEDKPGPAHQPQRLVRSVGGRQICF